MKLAEARKQALGQWGVVSLKELKDENHFWIHDIIGCSVIGRWLSEAGDVESLNMPTSSIEREISSAIALAMITQQEAIIKQLEKVLNYPFSEGKTENMLQAIINNLKGVKK